MSKAAAIRTGARGLSRRTLLRGVLGGVAASVALPPLEAMFSSNGNCYADGSPIPRRFGVWYWGNGVKADKFWPAATGANWTPGASLASLGALTSYVSLIRGTEVLYDKGSGHHVGAKTLLTGTYDPNASTYGSPTSASMDQVVAKAMSGQTLYDSLIVGVTRMNYEGSTNNGKTAYDFSGKTIRAEQSPQALFDRLFKTGTPPKTGPDPAKVSRLAVADIVLAQSKALKQRLGSGDKQTIDRWMEGIFTLQKKVEAAESVQCKVPGAPGIGMAQDKAKEPLQQIARAMSDLLAAAMICDLTRVFSFEFTGWQSSTIFSEIGVSEQLHNLTHDEPGDQPQVQKTIEHTFKQYAYLLQKLKDTPEGAGNLLDSCAIVATSDVADGRSHSTKDIPILIAGRAGGRLKPGRFIDPSLSGGSRINACRAPLTAMQAVVPTIQSFGAGIPKASAPITDLLA